MKRISNLSENTGKQQLKKLTVYISLIFHIVCNCHFSLLPKIIEKNEKDPIIYSFIH